MHLIGHSLFIAALHEVMTCEKLFLRLILLLVIPARSARSDQFVSMSQCATLFFLFVSSMWVYVSSEKCMIPFICAQVSALDIKLFSYESSQVTTYFSVVVSGGPAQETKMTTPQLACHFWNDSPPYSRQPQTESMFLWVTNRARTYGLLWANSILRSCDEGRSNSGLFSSKRSKMPHGACWSPSGAKSAKHNFPESANPNCRRTALLNSQTSNSLLIQSALTNGNVACFK
jgi:hypothetical protein